MSGPVQMGNGIAGRKKLILWMKYKKRKRSIITLAQRFQKSIVFQAQGIFKTSPSNCRTVLENT